MFAPSTPDPRALETTPNFPGDLTIERAARAPAKSFTIQSACWSGLKHRAAHIRVSGMNFPVDLTGAARILSVARIFLCYFFAYHAEVRQIRHPKRSCDGDVRGVTPGGHQYTAIAGVVMTRVESPPTIFEVHFKPRAEVHGRRGGRHTDIA